MKKVFIFVPAFGNMISATTFLTTHALQQTLMAKGVQSSISTLSFPDIAELRSMAVTVWYDQMKDSDYILMIDADMGFPPDLVMDMFMFDEPVVGTCYPKRTLPLQWSPSGTGEKEAEVRGGFMRVEGVGMGCTLISRDAITKILEKYPELVDTRIELHPAVQMLKQAGASRLLRVFEKMDIPDRGVISEDLSFCIRWNNCGGQVWANIAHKISHVGMFDFSACYLEVVQKAMAEEGKPVLDKQNMSGTVPAVMPISKEISVAA